MIERKVTYEQFTREKWSPQMRVCESREQAVELFDYYKSQETQGKLYRNIRLITIES